MRQWFGLLLVSCVSGFAGMSHPAEDVADKSREVLADLTFAQGFVLTGATHDAPQRVENFGQQDATPVWCMPQWSSKGLLDRVQVDDETVKLIDDYKSVTLDRKTGAINLTVHTSKEYETPRTSPSQPWVHLLLEQSPFPQPIQVADASAIWVEVEFELTENVAYGPQDPGLHAAQLSWFLYMKNTNRQSKGFHDFLWFGVSMFDSRYDFVPDYAAQDFAMPNGSFIYSLGSKRYFDKPVVVGERLTIRREILNDLREAIETAHKNGFITNTTIDDVVLDGTNIGWEVPGTYDVGVTLHKLSVTVVEKRDSR
ncbi:MAG: hypothetical protein FWD31_04045 [Planctomycetaceae bacterium]|nr:hypothetical protein [Planctomycetaceae bacterium]